MIHSFFRRAVGISLGALGLMVTLPVSMADASLNVQTHTTQQVSNDPAGTNYELGVDIQNSGFDTARDVLITLSPSGGAAPDCAIYNYRSNYAHFAVNIPSDLAYTVGFEVETYRTCTVTGTITSSNRPTQTFSETFTVAGHNEPPTASQLQVSAPAGVTFPISLDSVVDTDGVNWSTLQAWGGTGLPAGIMAIGPTRHGEVSTQGSFVLYTPDADAEGEVEYLWYEICDAGAPSRCIKERIIVTITEGTNELPAPYEMATRPKETTSSENGPVPGPRDTYNAKDASQKLFR